MHFNVFVTEFNEKNIQKIRIQRYSLKMDTKWNEQDTPISELNNLWKNINIFTTNKKNRIMLNVHPRGHADQNLVKQ